MNNTSSYDERRVIDLVSRMGTWGSKQKSASALTATLERAKRDVENSRKEVKRLTEMLNRKSTQKNFARRAKVLKHLGSAETFHKKCVDWLEGVQRMITESEK